MLSFEIDLPTAARHQTMSKPKSNTISVSQVRWRQTAPRSTRPYEIEVRTETGGYYLMFYASSPTDAVQQAHDAGKIRDGGYVDLVRPMSADDVAKRNKRVDAWARRRYEEQA